MQGCTWVAARSTSNANSAVMLMTSADSSFSSAHEAHDSIMPALSSWMGTYDWASQWPPGIMRQPTSSLSSSRQTIVRWLTTHDLRRPSQGLALQMLSTIGDQNSLNE